MLPIYYSSTEPNAPTLNNAAGSMIAVLDAVLVNGFGLKSVSSITVAGGVATVACTGHQFVGGIGRKVAIAGATPSALNGNQDVTVVDANTFTFSTAAAAGVATGTITAKRPSLGWTKPFTGTNTAMYQPTEVASTGLLLRVLDTAVTPATAEYARAFGVESATGIDTYTSQFPTQVQAPNGVYISKGANSTNAKEWYLVGDGRSLYLFSDDSSYGAATYVGLHLFAFGDINSWRSGGDAFSCIIAGGVSSNGQNTAYQSVTPGASNMFFIARQTNLIGGAVRASFWGRGQHIPGIDNTSGGAYPSPVDNGMALERTVFVREESATYGHPFRGIARGLAHPLAIISSNTTTLAAFHGKTFDGWIGTTDTFLAIGALSQGQTGALFFNLTSEW